MLLYLFFDSLLSTCPKKMETEKWPKAADSVLRSTKRPLRDLVPIFRKNMTQKENIIALLCTSSVDCISPLFIFY